MTGREPLLLLIVGAVLLVLSGIGPHDRATWWLEVAPVLIATPILVLTARRFPLTPLAYRLIFVHASGVNGRSEEHTSELQSP